MFGTMAGTVIDAYVNRDSFNASSRGCASATGVVKVVCTTVNVVRAAASVSEGVVVPVLLKIRKELGGSAEWNRTLERVVDTSAPSLPECTAGDAVSAVWRIAGQTHPDFQSEPIAGLSNCGHALEYDEDDEPTGRDTTDIMCPCQNVTIPRS